MSDNNLHARIGKNAFANMQAVRDCPFIGNFLLAGVGGEGHTVIGYGMTNLGDTEDFKLVIREDRGVGRVYTEFEMPEIESSAPTHDVMLSDPSGRYHWAANGEHVHRLSDSGKSIYRALDSEVPHRDGSNTPRIALKVSIPANKEKASLNMASIRPGRFVGIERSFSELRCNELELERGIFLPTCADNAAPGKQIPHFRGSPFPVPFIGSITEVAHSFWDILRPEQRIALVVRFIDPAAPVESKTCIINEREYKSYEQ